MLKSSFLTNKPARTIRSLQTPMMSTSTFDYDVVIVGCGVGGHGAALHARAQVRVSKMYATIFVFADLIATVLWWPVVQFVCLSTLVFPLQ